MSAGTRVRCRPAVDRPARGARGRRGAARRPHPGHAVREREARSPHLLAGRSGVGAAGRRSERSAPTRSRARSGAGVRAAAGAAGRRADRRDGHPDRPARRRRSQSSSGTLQLEGDTLVVRARSIALDAGRVQADVTERGALPELFATFERMARRIAPAATRCRRVSSATAAGRGLRELHQGTARGDAGDGDRLPERGAEASAGVRPRAAGALGRVHGPGRARARARGGEGRAVAIRPIRRRARFLAGLSQLDLAGTTRRLRRSRRWPTSDPSAAVLNNLGVVQLRRSASAQSGRPTYFFNKAAKADPDGRRLLLQPRLRVLVERDTQAAIYWLREAVRRRPADGDAHFVLGAALAAAGNTAEAAREKELARRLSSTSRSGRSGRRPIRSRGARAGEERRRAAARPRDRRRSSRRASSAISRSSRGSISIAAAPVRSARTTARRSAELERALYLSPYMARRICSSGASICAAAACRRRSTRSRSRSGARRPRRRTRSSARRTGRTEDLTSARAEADRALALDPTSAEAKALLARLTER